MNLVQKVLDGRSLTTRYRDKINLERHEIINNYSKEHSEQEEFYYVYNKRSDNTYGIVCYENGASAKNISIKENQLPKDAEVDCVLKIKNGKFVLDQDTTAIIQEKLTGMINELLQEQAQFLEEQRVEGHVYEFVEKTGNTVWLIDQTNYTGECFEEIDFPCELADKATQGTMFQYANGEYKLVNN